MLCLCCSFHHPPRQPVITPLPWTDPLVSFHLYYCHLYNFHLWKYYLISPLTAQHPSWKYIMLQQLLQSKACTSFGPPSFQLAAPDDRSQLQKKLNLSIPFSAFKNYLHLQLFPHAGTILKLDLFSKFTECPDYIH